MDNTSKKNTWLAKFSKALAAFLHQRYISTLIFVKGPAAWFPFLFTLLGSRIGLLETIDNVVTPTFWGYICMGVISLWVVICNFALDYDERINGKYDDLKSELKERTESAAILTDLKESMNTLCEGELRTLITRIDYYLRNPFQQPPEIVSDPEKQLDAIADELSKRIGHLLKFDQQRYGQGSLHTSIIYCFPQDKNDSWHCATPPRGLTVSELLKESGNRQSTFLFLLKSHRGPAVFFNSKQAAYEKDRYVPDEEDCYNENDKLKGSIACFHYRVMDKTDTMIVDFVITITSYNRRFVEDGGSEEVKKIKEYIDHIIMPGYVVRTKIELCRLYLSHLCEEWNSGGNISIHMKGVSPAEPDDSPNFRITLDGVKPRSAPDKPDSPSDPPR